jgi:hypothetical protein
MSEPGQYKEDCRLGASWGALPARIQCLLHCNRVFSQRGDGIWGEHRYCELPVWLAVALRMVFRGDPLGRISIPRFRVAARTGLLFFPVLAMPAEVVANKWMVGVGKTRLTERHLCCTCY